ncbi:ABC transporter ATP-binding protein [Phytoactinopolyspora alkaliphila]|uniref:ABC transporter ATP-binding protein n=2 Tax=Phytoactinopolyspora alkaliphila TaxID=1783498 RepID=A0A6N9YHC6_9ACTN|nr:ABC transporter ATP-binding protein [Phytoactinopolyspora alkaliphila]
MDVRTARSRTRQGTRRAGHGLPRLRITRGLNAREEGQEMTALKARGVRRTFEAELAPVRALRGVDLDVARGEFVALMGPSGCGKSTLLNIFAGLDQADEGEVFVDELQVHDRDENWLAKFRRHHVGIVFQFFNLLEGVSALDNIALPAILGGMRRKAAETRARDLLDLLGLGDRTEEVPSVLSGGQRQRLAIARALVNEPAVLLADEPTGALDSEGGVEILELFRRLHGDGQTILMVTHSADVASGASRVVRMRDGRIIGDDDDGQGNNDDGRAAGVDVMADAPAQTS